MIDVDAVVTVEHGGWRFTWQATRDATVKIGPEGQPGWVYQMDAPDTDRRVSAVNEVSPFHRSEARVPRSFDEVIAEFVEGCREWVAEHERVEAHDAGEHSSDMDVDCSLCRIEADELGMGHLMPGIDEEDDEYDDVAVENSESFLARAEEEAGR